MADDAAVLCVRRSARGLLIAVVLAVCGAGGAHAGGPTDPDALWKIVAGQCVPDETAHGDPAPCADVDVAAGQPRGYAVLKDIVGATQFLLIPTARVAGIESPELLAPGAPNYFAAAWRARRFVEQRAGRALPRDWVSLAVNSAMARTQNQLHIHIDCVADDVRDALAEHTGEVGTSWAPFTVPLRGHRYDAIAVQGDDLDGTDPFTVLADGLAGARANMGAQTLVVVGVLRADGQPGFVILADRADPAAGDPAAGEELQDHSCALLGR
ncbi:MAG: CDP-diacylglycerol pyrophosphatase [Mycobacterium sp.]|jgi:CDP-diacylglycerol pyrophosphatase|nr:CDP-diacylglycerol pyrophosphatase [Mycobacterium sp.]